MPRDCIENSIFGDEYEDTTVLPEDHFNMDFIARYTTQTGLITSNRRINNLVSPFRLFMDIYARLQNPISATSFKIEEYFEQVTPPIVKQRGDAIKVLRIPTRYSQVNIMPIISLINRSNEMIRELADIRYAMGESLINTLEKNINWDREVGSFYSNIDAYIEVFFHDIVMKWRQWTEVVNLQGGPYSLKRDCPYSLKRILYRKFWSNHFCFRTSKDTSLTEFKRLVNCASNEIYYTPCQEKNMFGVFLDLDECVLILTSPIGSPANSSIGYNNGVTIGGREKVTGTVRIVIGNYISPENYRSLNNMVFFYIHLACIYTFSENAQ